MVIRKATKIIRFSFRTNPKPHMNRKPNPIIANHKKVKTIDIYIRLGQFCKKSYKFYTQAKLGNSASYAIECNAIPCILFKNDYVII